MPVVRYDEIPHFLDDSDKFERFKAWYYKEYNEFKEEDRKCKGCNAQMKAREEHAKLNKKNT